MSRFLSDRFSSLTPYTPGEQPQDKEYIKLNTNESPYPPSPKVKEALTNSEVGNLKLYPDPNATLLTQELANFYGVKNEQIFIGNGSDEVLALCFMAFCDKENGIAFPDITYSFYPVYCELFGLERQIVPLNDNFEIDISDYKNIKESVIIANPNAPTGIALSLDEIESLLSQNPNRLVIIDEAYIDFGAKSCVGLIDKYDNLFCVQTFSKSRSLAGARVGFAIGNENLIADLSKIKFSFNSYTNSRLSLICATQALKDKEYFLKCKQEIIKTREKTCKSLENLGFDILPSSANFLFAKPQKIGAEEYYLALKDKGILVRYFNNKKINDRVRITIGTPNQMEKFIQITNLILQEES